MLEVRVTESGVRWFPPDALPALFRLGRGRGASSARIRADLNFPLSKVFRPRKLAG